MLTGGEAREHVARVPAYARLGVRARSSKATSEWLGDSFELGSQLAGSRQAARGLGFRGKRGLGGAHSRGTTAPWLATSGTMACEHAANRQQRLSRAFSTGESILEELIHVRVD